MSLLIWFVRAFWWVLVQLSFHQGLVVVPSFSIVVSLLFHNRSIVVTFSSGSISFQCRSIIIPCSFAYRPILVLWSFHDRPVTVRRFVVV